MEENELGRKRKTLKKHISMRLMNVFAKMNNSKKRGREIFMTYKMYERTAFGIVCWNTIKPDGQTNMTFHCSSNAKYAPPF